MSTDRVLSMLLLTAVLVAVYVVWLDRGEIDNLHARIDLLEQKIPKPRTNTKKPAA